MIKTVIEAKLEARKLRKELKSNGIEINHTSALHALSHKLGYKNWNSFRTSLEEYKTCSECGSDIFIVKVRDGDDFLACPNFGCINSVE